MGKNIVFILCLLMVFIIGFSFLAKPLVVLEKVWYGGEEDHELVGVILYLPREQPQNLPPEWWEENKDKNFSVEIQWVSPERL